MELKDVILSTLAEMEDISEIQDFKDDIVIEEKKIVIEEIIKDDLEIIEKDGPSIDIIIHDTPETEIAYLTSIQERLLVLFDGFQSPNNTHIESKIDMTLNFLEYILSTIELRLTSLEKGNK